MLAVMDGCALERLAEAVVRALCDRQRHTQRRPNPARARGPTQTLHAPRSRARPLPDIIENGPQNGGSRGTGRSERTRVSAGC
eukprot:10887790-Lingulodinium_polyedra.AAC.1